MKQLIALILISILSVSSYAEVVVKLEPQQVTLGDTFQLIITAENSQGAGVPNLVPLQKDFSILGTQRQITYTNINGQAQSVNQWVVLLRAKRAGILTIPAIEFAGEQSSPLTINVETKAQNTTLSPDQNKEVMLLTQIDEKKPYINQQLTYTVRLYNSKRLLDANYQGPEVEDALVIPLGETKHFQSTQNNIDYVVEEQRYAIFPQKSGKLTIKSPTFTALVYDYQPKRVTVQDKPIQLNVQPIPQKFIGKDWLPAKQIKLTEKYEQTGQTLSQGSTLTRTIKIEGLAIPAQLLPTIHFDESDAYKVYPERGKENNKVQQGELVSSTEIKVTYLFNKAGNITLPETKLHWFNTSTGKEDTSVLPPRSIEITPSATYQDTPKAKDVVSKPAEAVKPTPSVTHESLSVREQNQWPWILAILFAAAWLLTIGLWIWQKRPRNETKGQLKKALDELQQACQSQKPLQARDALLKWAALRWPDASLLNLTDVASLVRDPQLRKQLQLLSKVLYKQDDKTIWKGDELWRAIQAMRTNNYNSRSSSNPLPPINPI